MGSGFPILRRYVYGPDGDEPLVWYEGSGTSDRRYLVADERGSIVAVTDGAGAALALNSYDEYGIPGAGNVGRFQYTGQAWLAELGMYSYKARIYSPTMGRFLQPDPIGHAAGPNWYNYTNSDPVNNTDPSGLQGWGPLSRQSQFTLFGPFACLLCNDMYDADIFVVATIRCSTHKTDPRCGGGLIPQGITFAPGGDGASQASAGAGGGGGNTAAGKTPQGVNVDRSCAGNAAANDRTVQTAALTALNLASESDAEFGFFASENIFLSGYSVGPAFPSGDQRGITRSIVNRNQPGFFSSLFNGTYTPSLFVHTHQNNTPPSPISRPDQISAAQRGITYAAIDRAGNLTCSRN